MSGWLTARFPKFTQDRLLLVVDLIGTFVFAVEGTWRQSMRGWMCLG